MNEDDYKKLYFGDLEPTKRERKLHELAKMYHDAVDQFDKNTFSGYCDKLGPMPATAEERKASYRFAIKKRNQIIDLGKKYRLNKQEIVRAIQQYEGS